MRINWSEGLNLQTTWWRHLALPIAAFVAIFKWSNVISAHPILFGIILYCVIQALILIVLAVIKTPVFEGIANISSKRISDPALIPILNGARIIRIFASKGETYQTFLRSHLSGGMRGDAITIKLIFRTNGLESRQTEIEQEIRKWRQLEGLHRLRIQFATYEFSTTMIRGWVFDDKHAVIGHYLRNESGTHGQENTCLHLVRSDETKDHIDEIIKIFDEMFDKGKIS